MARDLPRVVVIDVETGGLDPNKHSLLQVGLVAHNSRGSILIKEPDIVMTEESQRIHGISRAMIDRHGLEPAAACDMIGRYLEHRLEPPIFAGHNVGFDLAFLDRLYRLAGRPAPRGLRYQAVDTHTLLWALAQRGTIPRRCVVLDHALAHFGIEVPEGARHTALGDARATRELLIKLLELGKGQVKAGVGVCEQARLSKAIADSRVVVDGVRWLRGRTGIWFASYRQACLKMWQTGGGQWFWVAGDVEDGITGGSMEEAMRAAMRAAARAADVEASNGAPPVERVTGMVDRYCAKEDRRLQQQRGSGSLLPPGVTQRYDAESMVWEWRQGDHRLQAENAVHEALGHTRTVELVREWASMPKGAAPTISWVRGCPAGDEMPALVSGAGPHPPQQAGGRKAGAS